MELDTQILPIETLSFEQAIRELEIIVRQLEEGRVDLNKAILFYERGNALKKHCEEKLKQAKMRIDQINVDDEGNVSVVPSSLQQAIET